MKDDAGYKKDQEQCSLQKVNGLSHLPLVKHVSLLYAELCNS